jgi:hypothetical protein
MDTGYFAPVEIIATMFVVWLVFDQFLHFVGVHVVRGWDE